MTTISVVYPREAGGTFDFDYYLNTHIPMVAQTWSNAGMTGGRALKGTVGGDGGDSPYFAIGLIDFESAEKLGAALAGEDAAKVLGDIPNFTNVTPIVQINEVAGTI